MKVSLSIISVFIVVSNVFVCVLSLRRYTNWLIVPLAISSPHRSSQAKYFTTMMLLSGVANISAVPYDRYVAIIKPLQYPHCAQKLFNRAIVVSWLLPVIYTLFRLFWDGDVTQTIHIAYTVVLEVLSVVVPYIFITFAYVRIFRQVRQSLRIRKKFESAREQRNERGRISSDTQATKVFCIISTAL